MISCSEFRASGCSLKKRKMIKMVESSLMLFSGSIGANFPADCVFRGRGGAGLVGVEVTREDGQIVIW